MTLYEELMYRGLIKDITSPDLKEQLNKGGLTFYIGTDATADSLHIGHLSSFLISKRLKDKGHHPILLIGGATGLIGDPRPTTEREILSKEQVMENAKSIQKQVENLFGFEVVNNYDWIKDIHIVDFLRDYGKFFNVNYMLDKDIIRRRLDEGITYAEFSYMLLQSLDFLHLFETKNCRLQVAGSDQWGNITAGVDLIRKKTKEEVFGFTMPLVTTKDGKKFGKSEGNALWLDKNKTSSYEMYQFLINVEDEKVIDYLKIFTFLSKEEIDQLAISNQRQPQLRLAHKALACEIITFLHGKEEYENAVSISEALFHGNIETLTKEQIEQGFKNVPHFMIKSPTNILNFLVDYGIASSKREAREWLQSGSIMVNGRKIEDENDQINPSMALFDNIIIVRRGKKKYYFGKFK